MSHVRVVGGTSSYFRLSTRPIAPALANLPDDPVLLERRRQQAVAGGYRLRNHPAAEDDVTLIGVGAIMPNVMAAAEVLAQHRVIAGVVCLTSPNLVYRSFQHRVIRDAGHVSSILDELLPQPAAAPVVTVHDGHPHTPAFLAEARGDRIRCLGVTEFGQSTNLEDAYALHGIDIGSIVDAAYTLTGRWRSPAPRRRSAS
jgi:pyruvate dehydrogenase E1 component